MYGLVNRAIEGLVKTNYGEDTWIKIKQKAGFNDPGFVGMKPYEDSITYKLVGAASEVLEIAPEKVLEAFGEYWILYTSEEGYGQLMEAGGKTFPDFLRNLNMMHFRLGNIMPELVMPEFDVTDETAHSLVLHYRSKRVGLAPMVIGLIRGLGKRFHLDCTIIHTVAKEDVNDHDLFKVTW